MIYIYLAIYFSKESLTFSKSFDNDYQQIIHCHKIIFGSRHAYNSSFRRGFIPLQADSLRLQNRDLNGSGKEQMAFEEQSLVVATRFAWNGPGGLLESDRCKRATNRAADRKDAIREATTDRNEGTRVLQKYTVTQVDVLFPFVRQSILPGDLLDQVQPLRRDLLSVYRNVRSLLRPRKTVWRIVKKSHSRPFLPARLQARQSVSNMCQTLSALVSMWHINSYFIVLDNDD